MKYLVLPLIIPIVLITINMIVIQGPYNVFTFSSKSQINASLYRLINGQTNEVLLSLGQSLQYLPQIQLLFISIQLGSVFLIFKLRGYIILIDEIKRNPQYALMLILTAIVLVIWSYLLGSGIVEERHVLYFIPLFSVVLVIGMETKQNQKTYYKLYYYGIIVFATYYFLFHNLFIYDYEIIYRNIFAGFITYQPTMNISDLAVSCILIVPLLIFELDEKKEIFSNFKKYNLHKYVPFVCIILLSSEVLILSSTRINVSALQKTDLTPPDLWEGDVFRVINYLNKQPDTKNVFSIRAPAIPFFTNRTNFDTYYPGAFNSITSLLLVKNSTMLDQKIREMNIGYMVIPNERNNYLYKYTRNVLDNFRLIQIIKADPNFTIIECCALERFDVYRYLGK